MKQPPEGYRRLQTGELIQRGDLWLRPYDQVWIETGMAHWGRHVDESDNIAARKATSFFTIGRHLEVTINLDGRILGNAIGQLLHS